MPIGVRRRAPGNMIEPTGRPAGSAPAWDLYRTLLAVLRGGSLAAAARELGPTQPTVARHIDELEAALGRPLFVRTQRGVAPIDAAHALRP